AIFKDVLKWEGAYDVLLSTVHQYFPSTISDQNFVSNQLKIHLASLSHRGQIGSLIWILLGAAGVFIPLETALNRLWRVQDDRPYWLNQIIGATLTIVCTLLALFFLSISAGLHKLVGYLPFELVRGAVRFLVVRSTMTSFFIAAVFVLYKFLPNKKI